jgi:hypothetical protein
MLDEQPYQAQRALSLAQGTGTHKVTVSCGGVQGSCLVVFAWRHIAACKVTHRDDVLAALVVLLDSCSLDDCSGSPADMATCNDYRRSRPSTAATAAGKA